MRTDNSIILRLAILYSLGALKLKIRSHSIRPIHSRVKVAEVAEYNYPTAYNHLLHTITSTSTSSDSLGHGLVPSEADRVRCCITFNPGVALCVCEQCSVGRKKGVICCVVSTVPFKLYK